MISFNNIRVGDIIRGTGAAYGADVIHKDTTFEIIGINQHSIIGIFLTNTIHPEILEQNWTIPESLFSKFVIEKAVPSTRSQLSTIINDIYIKEKEKLK